MLRLYDTRTRRAEDIRPAYPGEFRVLAVTPATGGEPSLGHLRHWLLPDLIRRCAERRGLVVTTCEIAGSPGSPGPADARGLGRTGEMLNIYPAARVAPASEPIARTIEFVAPGRTAATRGGPPPFDVATGDGDWLAGHADVTRHVAAPAGVTFDGRKLPAGDAGAPGTEPPDQAAPGLADVTARGLDPLAVRLALLGRRYHDDLDLSWDALEAADRTLRRWRRRVAEWALSPSVPMVRRGADAVAGAFDDDLDTPAALRELQAMEADEGTPDGAKFETFAFLDRLFGLDLAREIGRLAQG